MANQLYPFGKAHILGLATAVNLVSDNLKVLLVDTGVETYNAADEFHSSITSPVATSGNLAGKTVTSGVFDANDITFTAVSGSTIEAVILYKDTGVSATSPLIAWWDVTQFTPTGADVNLLWNASGIFAI